jgi:hypothetical protein
MLHRRTFTSKNHYKFAIVIQWRKFTIYYLAQNRNLKPTL